MLPFVEIFGFSLPMYGLLAILGLFIAVFVATRLANIAGVPASDIVFASFYCAIGILIGAKLMYFITMLPKFITNFDVRIGVKTFIKSHYNLLKKYIK